MIDIKQIIQEASIDARSKNVKFIKNLLIDGMNMERISSIVIFTASNPNSVQPIDTKTNDELLGTRYKSEFEKYFQHTFDISDGHKITATSAQEIFDYVSKRDITDKLGFGLVTQRE